MSRTMFGAILVGLWLAGCATDDPIPAAVAAEAPPPAQAAPVQVAQATAADRADFQTWLAGLRAEALSRGISAATFDAAFAGVQPNARTLELDTSQPEFVRPIWEYLASAVSETRVATGRQQLAAHQPTLAAVAQRYGVQPQYLVAIWGIESNYGQNTGSFNVIEALATLAWRGRRTDTFREFLLEALRVLENGDIHPSAMLGSWAGAMGQPQFMPGSYLRYAVDFNGDGRRDIWNTTADVFASTANYLREHGWQPGQRWGREVLLPQGFDFGLADPDVRRTLAEWQALGVRQADGTPLPAENFPASLLLPAGARGPAFLVYDNFRVILRYNNSTAYALAVGHLADRIAGAGPIQGRWPVEDRPLSRTDREELQRLLTARGFDTGGVDGVIGPQTRLAVRRYQQAIGAPADGHASAELLDRLRAGS